jgi:hypothetical protein
MSRKILLPSILFLILSQSALFAQTDKLPKYEDATAYEVYSAILTYPEATQLSKSNKLVIRRETLRNFGAFLDNDEPSKICLRPDDESAKTIGTALDDFVKVNKTKWQLQEKFRLEIPYKLVDSATIISIINPFTEKEDWKEFYKLYPDSNGFVDLSAVGFNADKTVAVVSKGRWCGGLCGEGEYYVLQKKEGKWIPLKWQGEGCSWVSRRIQLPRRIDEQF